MNDQQRAIIEDNDNKTELIRGEIKDLYNRAAQDGYRDACELDMKSLLHAITDIKIDIGWIKKELNGNGKEGLITKVYRHEKYFNMVAGGAAIISITFAVVKTFI